MKVYLLDTGILGKITYPTGKGNKPVVQWFQDMLTRKKEFRIPEICDYELRRKLLHLKYTRAVQLLDDYCSTVGYLPISTEAMRLAAELWAESRSKGKPTAPPEALDGDVILAAQARVLAQAGFQPIVVTENVGHLAWFTDAQEWKNVNPAVA